MKKINLLPLTLMTGAFVMSCTTDKEIAETENPVPVQIGVASLVTGDKISVSGQIESLSTAVISTRMMGFISNIYVSPGDRVKKGQLLVSISSDDIQAKRAQAAAMVSEAEAALEDAKNDFERYRKLHEKGSASDKEFENALLRYSALGAKTDAARQLRREADAMLAYTNLVAPFSGVITAKHVDEGSMANPGMPILTIEEPSGFQIHVLVSEREVGRLQNEMKAEVTVKSTGRTFQAKISEISPSSQSTGGRFQVKLNVPTAENAGLFSGMYVNVNISVENDGLTRLFVPDSVIIYRDQLTGLYTVDSQLKAQLRWLKLGKAEGNKVEVLSGLLPEEKFITRSESRLYSGESVAVSNEKITSAQ